MYSKRVGIELQLASGGLGQRLAGQVVGRRPQSAGGHDQIGPVDRLAKNLDARLQFVADRGVKEHANAQFFQPLAEPLGIGVEQLTAGDFVTDGEDFGVHGSNWLVLSPFLIESRYGPLSVPGPPYAIKH